MAYSVHTESRETQPCEHNSPAATEWPHLQLSCNTWLILHYNNMSSSIQMSHSSPIARLSTPALSTMHSSGGILRLMDRRKIRWKLLILWCVPTPPLPSLPPGTWAPSYASHQYFPQPPKMQSALKAFVTGWVREGGGCTLLFMETSPWLGPWLALAFPTQKQW